jgi:hypothetical protein
VWAPVGVRCPGATRAQCLARRAGTASSPLPLLWATTMSCQRLRRRLWLIPAPASQRSKGCLHRTSLDPLVLPPRAGHSSPPLAAHRAQGRRARAAGGAAVPVAVPVAVPGAGRSPEAQMPPGAAGAPRACPALAGTARRRQGTPPAPLLPQRQRPRPRGELGRPGVQGRAPPARAPQPAR